MSFSSASPPNPHQTIARAVKQARDSGAPLDARAALASHPGPHPNRVIALDLAYEEYCRHHDAGTAEPIEEYCARFPGYRSTLRRMLEVHCGLEPGAPMLRETPERWPEPGDRIGDFALVRELGPGAFARVFLANDVSTGGRPVAVKLTYDVSGEAHTVGPLKHDNIVPILSAPSDPFTGLNIVCMPFLGSATLEDVLDRAFPSAGDAPPRQASVILDAMRLSAQPGDPTHEGAPAPALARGNYTGGVVWLGAEIASALAYLHARKVFHGDLKPSNVLVGLDGRPRLLDFNLASQIGASLARVGGTMPYMAPEYLSAYLAPGERKNAAPDIDGRADLFSLGVMLYLLLTGDHPFGPVPVGLKPEQLGPLLLQRYQAGPTPLRTLNSDVDTSSARLIESCLAFDRNRRPRDAAFLAEALRQQLGVFGRLRRFVLHQRRRTLMAGAGLLLSVGVLLAGALSPAPSRPPPPRAPSAREWSQMGGAAADRGQLAEAVRCYREAVAADASDWQAHQALGRAYIVQGQAELSAGKAAVAKKLFKSADKSFDRAIELSRSATKDEAGSWEANYGKGRAQMLQGFYPGAETHFVTAGQSHQPPWQHAPTQACLAYCLARRRAYGEASHRGAEARRLGYLSAALLSNLGFCYIQDGQLAKAERPLREALMLTPDFVTAHHNLAYLGYKRCLTAPAEDFPPLLLSTALSDVERYLAVILKTRPREAPEVYGLAVRLYGLSLLEKSFQPSTREDRRTRGSRYLEAACQDGTIPRLLLRDDILNEAFLGHPVFKFQPRKKAPPRSERSFAGPLLAPFE